jgi:hypothetical protein
VWLRPKRRHKEVYKLDKEVYGNCYVCGKELIKGQDIVTVHQYYYCDEECLMCDVKKITLGEQYEKRAGLDIKGDIVKGVIFK